MWSLISETFLLYIGGSQISLMLVIFVIFVFVWEYMAIPVTLVLPEKAIIIDAPVTPELRQLKNILHLVALHLC